MADDRYVDAPPAGADAWREVWRDDRRFRPRTSKHDWLLRLVRRLVGRAGEPEAERQKNFNIALLDLVADVRRELDAVRGDLRGDLEAVQRDLAGALAAESTRLRELVITAAKRNDALIAALDQKIETVAVRVRDAVNPSVPRDVNVEARREDLLYRRLEDALRGSEAAIRMDVAPYVRLAADHQPVLDAGCGRGEFLEACRAAGIAARGVDTNERSVADLRARGLDVALAGVPECFAPVEDASLGSVVAMHVVEHLPVEALFALFRESARVLRADGLLIVETPNAESAAFAASDFWRDPTHLAPRHAAALTVLAREHGFEIAEARPVHELPDGTRIPILETDAPELQRVIHAVNDRFFAPPDFRLIARRMA
ncbi:MAG: methyltransferase domain-containing protein [Acidobacteria bacterium]|nr:methyltransferase domain-containing protein [Acidobacteriota bacterium]MBV9477054.1 methyltransferase domain-containing protein [Acidobacteriota bacterium]